MKIVADESVDKQIVDRLRSDGHDVVFIAELDPGIDDEAVLLKSRQSDAVLLTADKDFGELVFRQRLLHSGVVLIRLADLETGAKADLVATTFAVHAEVSNTDLRFSPLERFGCGRCSRSRTSFRSKSLGVLSGHARRRRAPLTPRSPCGSTPVRCRLST